MNIKDIPAQQAAQHRRLNRKAIFDLNRRYLQLNQNIDDVDFSISCPFIKDPDYRSIIRSFSQISYSIRDAPRLASYIFDKDILKAFQGNIGLCKIGIQNIRGEILQEILNKGVIRHIMLLKILDNKFLLYLGVRLLSVLVKMLSDLQFQTYCTPHYLPDLFFICCLRLRSDMFESAIVLINNLKERGRQINYSDRNIEFITRVYKCFQKQVQIENISKLLVFIRFSFLTGFTAFANMYFSIKCKILEIYRANKENAKIFNQIRLITIGYIKTMLQNFDFNQLNKTPFVKKYFQDAIDATFQIRLEGDNYIFHYFYQNILTNCSLETMKRILNRTLHLLFDLINQNKFEFRQASNRCFMIIKQLLQKKNPQIIQQIFNNDSLFKTIVQQYKLFTENINYIVILLVQFGGQSAIRTLKKYQLIRLFFQKSQKMHRHLAVRAFRELGDALRVLMNKNLQEYKLVKNDIVTEDNYKIIMNLKEIINIAHAPPVWEFYENLRNNQ